MYIYPPSPCAFYLQHNEAALTGAETAHGPEALATRLRQIARLYRFPTWENGTREIIAALLETNALVIHDTDCNRLSWTDLVPILNATLPRGRFRNRDFTYRNGPVPHTGRYARGCYYRAPGYHSGMIAEAIAAAGAADCDFLNAHQLKAITHRKKHITERDDVPRCRERTWKRQRATRWR